MAEDAVVLGRVGAYCGSVYIAKGPFWPTDNTILAKPKNGHSVRYVYYLLKNTPIRAFAGGAAQPLITQQILSGIRVRVHDVTAAAKIDDTLSAYDDLIENNRQRIALLEKAARLLYREWFVHFRFPGHGHVEITDGLPAGWERRTLSDIAETNKESYRAKELPDEINYIDISSVAQGRVVSKTRVPASEAPGRARRKIRDGDTIWSNVRPNLRAYALMLEPDELDVVSTGFTVLTATKVPFTWLYMFVTTDNFVGHLVNHATGVGYRLFDLTISNVLGCQYRLGYCSTTSTKLPNPIYG